MADALLAQLGRAVHRVLKNTTLPASSDLPLLPSLDMQRQYCPQAVALPCRLYTLLDSVHTFIYILRAILPTHVHSVHSVHLQSISASCKENANHDDRPCCQLKLL